MLDISTKSISFDPDVSPRRPLTLSEKLKYFFTATSFISFEPPPSVDGKKTLVLDLDETLIHSSTFKPGDGVECIKKDNISTERPYIYLRGGLREFLKYCYDNFDLFIFTAAREEYADFIIDNIFPLIAADHRLYRDSCFPLNDNKVKKDTSILKRRPEDLILIDDSYSNYRANPGNTLLISDWKGTPGDKVLMEWAVPILERCKNADDVRIVLSTVPVNHRRRSTMF